MSRGLEAKLLREGGWMFTTNSAVPCRICPPVHPAARGKPQSLMFIALTNHFYNKENRRGRN